MSVEREELERIEVDAEKLALVGAVSVFLFGAVLGSGISLEAGHVVQAVLAPSSVSGNWAGVSGELSGFQEETAKPLDFFYVDDERSGTVNDLSLPGQDDGDHFLASVPFYTDNFQSESLGNVSLTDLEADGLFDEEKFPAFYPNSSSYDEVDDNPEKTFEHSGTIELLDREFDSVKTELNDGIEYHLLSYSDGDDVYPVFLTRIQDYESCYDGNSCDYQFMLPEVDDDYSFYMLSRENPVDITTFIDGEESTEFPYSGRPYNLTVTTEAIFDDYRPLDTEIRITEREGNNLFVPAISEAYDSRSQIVTETVEGSATVMMSPTQYNSPDNYNLTVDVYSDGEAYDNVSLTVANDNIEFTDSGPVAKGFDSLENEYKKGVDRLRPVASCLYSNVNSDNAYRLEASPGESFETVRGVPYVVSPDSEFFSLVEQGSHLVMSPARNESTVHLDSGGLYSSDDDVVFTPTLGSSEDDELGIELYDGQGDLLGETNLSVRDSTCGDVTDGGQIDAPELNSFKKRVNAVRPVLNSLFVAGS